MAEFNSDCNEVLRGAEPWSGRSLEEPGPPGPGHFPSVVCPSPTPAQPRRSHLSFNLLIQWFVISCPGLCIKFQCILTS